MLPSLLVKQKALQIGFDLAGIAPLDVWKDLNFARRWVEQGCGGEMRYLANPHRDDPRLVLPSARSVICVGLVYNAPYPYSTEVRQDTPDDSLGGVENGDGAVPSRAWISRYAWGRDYHELMRARLEDFRKEIERFAPSAETRVYVDTGPVVERAFARHSGIGWTGKNTCLINPSKGSWFFLGVILTSLELEPDVPTPDRCGTCTRCLDACPTQALTKPYVMDASLCIAYFTIELKGAIPEVFRPKIGANFFGCDICQDVCPWNGKDTDQEGRAEGIALGGKRRRKGCGREGAATTALPEFQPMQLALPDPATPRGDLPSRAGVAEETLGTSVRSFSLFHPPLEALAQMDEDDFRRELARSPLKRPKYRGWLRNLCVVMGNSGHPAFVPRLEKLSHHEDPVIRDHAEWGLARLNTLLQHRRNAPARSPVPRPEDGADGRPIRSS